MKPATSWPKRIGWTILLLTCALFAVRGVHNTGMFLRSRDFKPLYGGAACLVAHCNPYDNLDIRAQYAARGGDLTDPIPFSPHYLGYPPDALFFIIPFTFLSYHAAQTLWLILILTALLLGAIAMGDLCAPYAPILGMASLAFMLRSSTLIIALGQPTALVLGLLMIGVWCLLRRRFQPFGILCFALSLIFKPHLGALVLLYFFLANSSYRRRAWQVVGLTIVLALPGLIWATAMPQSRPWPHNLAVSLTEVASNGRFSDPGPTNKEAYQLTNLQTCFSLLHNDPHFYNPATYLTWLPFFLLWIYPVLTLRDGPRKDFLCLAAIAALDMLPAYHRLYDTRLLFMTFPALSLLLRQSPLQGGIMLVISTCTTLLLSEKVGHFLGRPMAIACSVIALSYLICCYLSLWQQRRHAVAPHSTLQELDAHQRTGDRIPAASLYP